MKTAINVNPVRNFWALQITVSNQRVCSFVLFWFSFVSSEVEYVSPQMSQLNSIIWILNIRQFIKMLWLILAFKVVYHRQCFFGIPNSLLTAVWTTFNVLKNKMKTSSDHVTTWMNDRLMPISIELHQSSLFSESKALVMGVVMAFSGSIVPTVKYSIRPSSPCMLTLTLLSRKLGGKKGMITEGQRQNDTLRVTARS